MSNTKSNSRMVVGSICASLLLGTLGAHAANLPPEPNNAALLYYQAFLLCPDPCDLPVWFGQIFRHDWAQYMGKCREYMKDYQDMIQLVEAASKVPHCNWAIPYLQGPKVRPKQGKKLLLILNLIGANVHILAADGNYRDALSESLLLRRVARHLADDPDALEGLIARVEWDALSNVCVVLGVMPPDKETLIALREQLDAEPLITELFPGRIKQDFQWLIRTIKRTGTTTLSDLRNDLTENAKNEAQKNKVMALTDDELLTLIQESYAGYLDSAFDVMGSQMSYEQKYVRLDDMVQQYWERAKTNPEIILALRLRAGKVLSCYSMGINHVALLNAINASIEIYLLKATSGRLPEALPEGLPKDPFSGKDFEYSATKEGFVLRCRAKEITSGDVRQYEFKVQE